VVIDAGVGLDRLEALGELLAGVTQRRIVGRLEVEDDAVLAVRTSGLDQGAIWSAGMRYGPEQDGQTMNI
jgi:hypothetical protein